LIFHRPVPGPLTGERNSDMTNTNKIATKIIVYEAETIEILKQKSLAAAAGYLHSQNLRYNGSVYRYRCQHSGDLFDLRRLPDGRLALRKLTPVGEFSSPRTADAFVYAAREAAPKGREFFWVKV
jgi:hypothetical protein